MRKKIIPVKRFKKIIFFLTRQKDQIKEYLRFSFTDALINTVLTYFSYSSFYMWSSSLRRTRLKKLSSCTAATRPSLTNGRSSYPFQWCQSFSQTIRCHYIERAQIIRSQAKDDMDLSFPCINYEIPDHRLLPKRGREG